MEVELFLCLVELSVSMGEFLDKEVVLGLELGDGLGQFEDLWLVVFLFLYHFILKQLYLFRYYLVQSSHLLVLLSFIYLELI